MWSVSPPPVSAEQAARWSVHRINDADRAKRVRAVFAEFTENSEELQRKARTHQMARVLGSPPQITDVSDDELKWLYNAQVGMKGRPAYKEVYERMLAIARAGLCSYCQYGRAKTLDHFVPKKLVPALSIDPWNLIPSCFDCNHELRENFSEDDNEQFLHPYAMPPVGRWLKARVVRADPMAVTYTAEPNASLDPGIAARIKNQFGRLKLASMYTVASAPELMELSRMLQREFGSGNPGDVRASLARDALALQEVDLNGRRGAMYEALSSDDWFCEEGYMQAMVAVLP